MTVWRFPSVAIPPQTSRVLLYVLKTDLMPQHAKKELVHDRYKDLAAVEHAFRTCKTAHLEVRPIFLRLAARTRAHAFVVMLASQIIQHLASCWSTFDLTVEEGLHALTTLCLVEVSPKNAPSYHCIPTPRDAIASLLHSADIKLPKAFSLSGVRVSTKKKLQSAHSALWAGFGHLHPCFRGRLVVRLMYRCRV